MRIKKTIITWFRVMLVEFVLPDTDRVPFFIGLSCENVKCEKSRIFFCERHRCDFYSTLRTINNKKSRDSFFPWEGTEGDAEWLEKAFIWTRPSLLWKRLSSSTNGWYVEQWLFGHALSFCYWQAKCPCPLIANEFAEELYHPRESNHYVCVV